MKRADVISYSLLTASIVLLAFSAGAAIQKIKIRYMSRSVQVSADFESGSVKEIRLIDAHKIKGLTDERTWQLTYTVTPQDDPVNPVDSSLLPSNRWFYFRMTGVGNKHIRLLFHHTDPIRPVYSYDGANFQRFSVHEAAFREISKLFTCDTVYLAYYIPYTFDFLQERISQWSDNSDVVKMDTIGWSVQNRPLQMLTVTDPSVPDRQKHRVYIHARIHPGASGLNCLSR